ncbi:MAG TPA: glycosyltransferase [Peptococcaceae bacterium]|nr:glycosyltransferase [Peptococcaceae bacterium]
MTALWLLSLFVFSYPIAMSVVWVIGGLYYWFNYELKEKKGLYSLKTYPSVTILVPCHNEAQTIEITCKNLSVLDYDNYQVIFIDDASKDNTAALIRPFVAKYPYFHLLCLRENQGKAGALNAALKLVKTPFVLVLDADTLISGKTLKWLVLPFTRRTNLAAVTANPIPYNKDCFLSKFQTGEFMSIIGLIKRSQSIFGYLFTISGCATLYKTNLLREVGGFSSITATEDIDITWRIQVPNRLKEYWKQRKRWAMGGWHLLRTHKDIFSNRHLRHLWILYFDFVLAYTWAFCLVTAILLALLSVSLDLNLGFSFLPFPYCAFALTAFSIQSICALRLNSFYDPSIKECLLYVPWYPLFFYLVGAVLIVRTSLKGLFGDLKNSGKWSSPQRLSLKQVGQGRST